MASAFQYVVTSDKLSLHHCDSLCYMFAAFSELHIHEMQLATYKLSLNHAPHILTGMESPFLLFHNSIIPCLSLYAPRRRQLKNSLGRYPSTMSSVSVRSCSTRDVLISAFLVANEFLLTSVVQASL